MNFNYAVKLFVTLWLFVKDAAHFLVDQPLDVHQRGLSTQGVQSWGRLLDQVSRIAILASFLVLVEIKLDNLGLFCLVWHVVNHRVLSVLIDVKHFVLVVEEL